MHFEYSSRSVFFRKYYERETTIQITTKQEIMNNNVNMNRKQKRERQETGNRNRWNVRTVWSLGLRATDRRSTMLRRSIRTCNIDRHLLGHVGHIFRFLNIRLAKENDFIVYRESLQRVEWSGNSQSDGYDDGCLRLRSPGMNHAAAVVH